MPEQIIPSKDGQSFSAYVAMPTVSPAPVIVMIQEIFGVNAEMRAKCDAMAAQGYIAVAPDLFWRQQPNLQLTDKTEAEWKQAFALMNGFDVDLGIEDLRATAHRFRGHAQATGVVGCVGYCLGGKLAYLMAARTTIDAAVAYYGVGLETLLDEAKTIKKPLLMHMGEADKFVPAAAQAKIKDGLKDNQNITIYSYANADHAFSRINGEHYDAAAAELANARTAAFLETHLKKARAI